MRLHHLPLTVLLALVLVGCATGEFRGRSSAPAFPPYKGEVRLLERFPASGTFERLGVVTVKVGVVQYANTLTNKLKKTAAARGANAVVLQGKARETSEGSILAGWAIRVRAP